MDATRTSRGLALPAMLLAFAPLAACGASPPPKPVEPTQTTAAPTATAAPSATPPNEGADAECDLVCQGAQVEVPRVLPPGETADEHTQKATEQANKTLADMHADLLACYKTRLAQAPKAHGSITIDIIVGETGAVRDVETTGGAILGEAAMACIVERVKKGTFAPVHGGGTRRIHVPFNFNRAGADTST